MAKRKAREKTRERRVGVRRRWFLIVGAAITAVVVASRRASERAHAAARPADASFMLAIHEAMRRDLARLRHACSELGDTQAVPAGVRDGWAVLRREIEFHHRAEDEDLWPKLRARADTPEVAATIDAMVQEHQRIPAALDGVSAALQAGAGFAAAADNVVSSVEEHLEHEERAAVPLIERYLTAADWREFLHTERRKRPAREAPVFIAWVLDGSPAHGDAVVRELPPPARLLHRYVLGPKYEQRRLWSLDASTAGQTSRAGDREPALSHR
jgi:iron-sulfur cluster repair protein YtfE (RIC family)